MHYKRINTGHDPSARLGFKLYETAFPYHEQREQPSQARIMTDPEYHFTVIEDHDQPIGLVFIGRRPPLSTSNTSSFFLSAAVSVTEVEC